MEAQKIVVRAMEAAWRETVARCTRPHHAQYHYYGGRGITICKRWLVFKNYLADMGLRPPGMTLERKDNARGYSKSNCVWATRKAQTANRRASRRLTYKGETLSLKEWAERTGIGYYTLKARVNVGYSPKDVLTKPVKPGAKLEGRRYAPRKKPDTRNMRRGEACAQAKLSDADALEIRRRHAAGGASYTRLAAEYDVCFQSIAQVVTRKTFKHI